jgi:Lrp/AsnC family leucine-responsive transcriptional regulator
MNVDDVDLKILSMLQGDGRISNVEIARQLKLAPSGTLERIRKLRNRGVIQEFTARLNPKDLEMGLLAFVFLKTGTAGEKWDVGAMVAEIPEVLEVHDIAGDDCYIIKIRTRDTDSLYRLLRDKLGRIGSILSSRTTIVLRTVKESTRIPLAVPAKAPKAKHHKQGPRSKEEKSR